MRAHPARAVPALLCLFWVVFPLSCQQRKGLSSEQIARIEQVVAEAREQGRVPGLSVAVATGGELRWSRGFGTADLEHSVPAKPETVYRLGSVSKPITAVAVLQLAEAGKLDLDAPVRTYVPSFPEKPWPITLRQLLCHQGGIRHYRPLWFEVNHTFHYTDLIEPLRLFQDDPLVAEPGTKYSYSTFGYVLLGAVVEAVSGQPFVDYLREHVFGPAGMARTRPDDVHAIIPSRARGYRLSRNGEVENCDLVDTSYKIPGGGLSSTVGDMVAFALAVRTGRLLRPETVEMMWTPQKLRSGEVTEYGLGWFIRDVNGTRQISHGGNQNGVTANLTILPDEGIVVASLANLEQVNLPELTGRILEVLRR